MASLKCSNCGTSNDYNEGAPPWVLTFGDMMTLLLCFFVILFSMSTLEIKKYDTLVEIFKGAFGVLQNRAAFDSKTTKLKTKKSKGKLKKRIQAKLGTADKNLSGGQELGKEIGRKSLQEKGKKFGDKSGEKEGPESTKEEISVIEAEEGIIIRFPEKALFSSGKAKLTKGGKELLNTVSTKILTDDLAKDKGVRIEGHTDNVPISTKMFPSNWELSTTRATTVLQFLLKNKELDPLRFAAAGYGEYRPIAENNTIEGKKKNRRVEVIILTKTVEDIKASLAQARSNFDEEAILEPENIPKFKLGIKEKLEEKLEDKSKK